MFQRRHWPFTPLSLTEILGEETLAVIATGGKERLGKAITVLDYNPRTGIFDRRIEVLKQVWEPFCSLFRNSSRVLGGDAACITCDEIEARVSLKEFEQTGNPFRTFPCHMGLQEATYVIRIANRPVALLYSGQCRPPDGIAQVVERLGRLGRGQYAPIQPDDAARGELAKWAEQLPPMPSDIRERLAREADYIQRIAEAEYRLGKYRRQQEFLGALRQPAEDQPVADLENLRPKVCRLLEDVQAFCHSAYAAFFASMQEGETVLAPVAAIGVALSAQNLPHFNWKKVGLPEGELAPQADAIRRPREWLKGIRGENSKVFANASCALPVLLGHRYRGVLVLGPFEEKVDLQEEGLFLGEVANVVGSYVLNELAVRHLNQQRRRWTSTLSLLNHQLRTALTPIVTQVGRARSILQGSREVFSNTRLPDLLTRAENLCVQLAQSSRETLDGHMLQLEREDLSFEPYPLSVLMVSCVDSFVPKAAAENRKLEIDKGVEDLPEAEVDVARLTIVISNLIENAIKYSFPNTTIYVRSYLDWMSDHDRTFAVVEFDDLGEQIRPEYYGRLFEEGTRGLTQAKLGSIPGSGLGLWEARNVIEAHGGRITFSCSATAIRRPQGAAYRVIFRVAIPLKQEDDKGGP